MIASAAAEPAIDSDCSTSAASDLTWPAASAEALTSVVCASRAPDRTEAAVALPVGDATLDGPIAAALRRAAYLYRMPTNEHRAKLATSWLEQGAELAAKEAPGILKSLGVPLPDFLAPNNNRP